mgnify:CR=1 FL=1
MEKVSINGYVLDTTTEEDHKRAMLHAVFDALDMDIEKEIHIYRISKEKESYANKEKIRIMQNELAEAARPLAEYIRKCQTPMTTAIVTGADVTLMAIETHAAVDGKWD